MSVVLGNPMTMGAGRSKLDFIYTGNYTEREDGVVELTSSGVITFRKKCVIDVFMVGGGGGGGNSRSTTNTSRYSGGGGGGYTLTKKYIQVSAQESISITIGAGGASGKVGGTTSWGDSYSVGGGKNGEFPNNYNGNGGNGGSGGGGGGRGGTDGALIGKGGSDGADGGAGGARGGVGQHSTTREFGEPTGKLYAGGGSGGLGGTGGDGDGGNASYNSAGGNGEENTGGGGGGVTSKNSPNNYIGGTGGSGIVCFRLSA